MSLKCFNKIPPTFDELSIEFWKREVVNDLFLMIQNIVAGTATLSKKILTKKCLQLTVELFSNSPRIILQYELKCDGDETIQTIPVKDYQIMDDNSDTVDDDGNIISLKSIATSVEIENTFSPVCKLQKEIPEIFCILNDNEEIKDKNVEKNQITSSVETHINFSSTSHSEKNINASIATLQTKGQKGNCDTLILNKRTKEIETDEVIKRNKPNTYSCIYYEKPFNRESMKQGHERIHASEKHLLSAKVGHPLSRSNNLNEKKLYMSNTSEQSFLESQQPSHHSKIHTDEKAYKCEKCDKCFTDEDSLRVHQKVHTGNKSFKCEECGKCFILAYHLKFHQKVHIREKSFKCEECGKCFTGSKGLICHRRIHTGEKPFKCDVCDKSFAQSSNLRSHQKLHTGERPFKCEQCDKRYIHASQLRAHQKLHTSDKAFECEICGKSFIHSITLIYHRRIHTGERPFKCEECGRCFTQASNLTSHKRIHTGERPFKCGNCDKSFICSSALLIHTRIHTGEKPYNCEECGECFTQKMHLKLHQRIHTG